jgi:hypothetical protein
MYSAVLLYVLWFASNAVMSDLVENFWFKGNNWRFNFPQSNLVYPRNIIVCTFSNCRSVFTFKVFLVVLLEVAAFNMTLIWEGNTLMSMLVIRFLTDFSCWIYPIGMKIAADYYFNKALEIAWFLGRRLGNWHSLPTFAKSFTVWLPWKYVLMHLYTSYFWWRRHFFSSWWSLSKTKSGINTKALLLYLKQKLRSAALGYLDICGTVYFWTFTPLLFKPFLPHLKLTFPFYLLIIGLAD